MTSGRDISRSHENWGSPPSPRTSTMGARSVESNALHTEVTTVESSVPPRLQRPTYEEPILPPFVETPTATTKRIPKSDKLVTTLVGAEQSTKRQRQEEIPREEGEEDEEDSCTLKFSNWLHNNGPEKNVYQLDAWIQEANPQISSRNFWMDLERSRSRGNLDSSCGRYGRLSACEQRFQSSRGVSILSFNSCQNLHYVHTDLCTVTYFPSSACSQIVADQLYSTQSILRALTLGSKQDLSQVISTASLVEPSAVILSSSNHTTSAQGPFFETADPRRSNLSFTTTEPLDV